MADDIMKQVIDTVTVHNKAALADHFKAEASTFKAALLAISSIASDPLGTPGSYMTDGRRLVEIHKVAKDALNPRLKGGDDG